MSLINKMLQDLDARGGSPAGAPPQPSVKLVPRIERRPARPMMAGAALLLLAALVAGGYFGGRALQRPRPPVAVVVAAPVKTVLLAPLPPVKAVAMAILPAPVAPSPAAAAGAGPVVAAPIAPIAPALSRKEKPAEKSSVAATQKLEPAAALNPGGTPNLTASQRAETEYRRALATLAEGRGGDAIAGLEQVLLIDPRHEAARQTLVGLLIENKRPDDAMRQLQVALAFDPRQPAMAMLLARLQIERGESGVDTLQRSLAYAAGNSDYHAFLAGALQRQGRHREAAEQYGAALRGNAQNSVWLMGLGISLQAEKRNAEAIDAFGKAKASATLPPELQAFVERKLVQLGQ
jgi:MSHA biogenesis protein MshN